MGQSSARLASLGANPYNEAAVSATVTFEGHPLPAPALSVARQLPEGGDRSGSLAGGDRQGGQPGACRDSAREAGRQVTTRSLRVVFLGCVLLLAGCVELAPLKNPPGAPDERIDSVSTRAEAVARFGPPAEVRASDLGEVLVYRRPTVVDETPNRFYGTDYGNRFVRYELWLLYLDQDGRVVQRVVRPE